MKISVMILLPHVGYLAFHCATKSEIFYFSNFINNLVQCISPIDGACMARTFTSQSCSLFWEGCPIIRASVDYNNGIVSSLQPLSLDLYPELIK